MTKLTKPQLGSTVTDGTKPGLRDAFHVAAVLVTCKESVRPGNGLLVSGSVADYYYTRRNAIADPFLPDIPVPPGTAFWALILPDKVGGFGHTFEIAGEGVAAPKPPPASDDDEEGTGCRTMGCP